MNKLTAKHKKNEEYSILITDIGTNGEGIGHIEDGYTLFVRGAIIGDTVLTRIIKPAKNYGIGKLMRIISPSPYRIETACPISNRCGGCQISSLSYEKQLELKENKVRELLIRLGGFDADYIDSVFNPIEGYDGDPFRYRNKAQYPVGTDRDGNPIIGFYSVHSHRIVPCDDCLIGSDADASIKSCILSYIIKNHISCYDESANTGLIRHILIRTAYATGEVMVCLVINGKSLPEKDELVNQLLAIDFEGKWKITSICTSSNTTDTNVIMGNSYDIIFGNGYITDKIGEISFQISPLSFFQVNPAQTEKLYSLALKYAALNGNETVWDLYCGIGTISLFLAQKAQYVKGVEIIPQAIDNAITNARINGITNVDFYVGKAEEVLPEYYSNANAGDKALVPDVIVVDPPRKGCDTTCLDTMLKMTPSRIVYISCDPATLSRDLKYLCVDGAYQLSAVTPVDMFPHSSHVETAVLLNRQIK